MDLLKPVKVDPWLEYRFYEEDQGGVFVKIKNLQRTGFTVEEMKGLLNADNRVIGEAFEAKSEEGEKRLQEMKEKVTQALQ